ncbi:hypothetical protein BC628DRAFT_346337 [Trametes gibbosa]|nr:hypothetical protein BC628DRAFT_346337 [Trametes gibbosa]
MVMLPALLRHTRTSASTGIVKCVLRGTLLDNRDFGFLGFMGKYSISLGRCCHVGFSCGVVRCLVWLVLFCAVQCGVPECMTLCPLGLVSYARCYRLLGRSRRSLSVLTFEASPPWSGIFPSDYKNSPSQHQIFDQLASSTVPGALSNQNQTCPRPALTRLGHRDCNRRPPRPRVRDYSLK